MIWQAKNVVNYLRIIHKILAPGGVWINLGLNWSNSYEDAKKLSFQVLCYGIGNIIIPTTRRSS